MATFGLILLRVFVSRARGGVGSMLPAWTIVGLYVVFGVGALVASGFDPFFLVFIIPGGLVLIGVVSALLVRRSLLSVATQAGVR